MSRYQDGVRSCLQNNFKQITAVKSQYGPSVGREIAYTSKPVSNAVSIFKGGRIDKVVYFTDFTVTFVNGTDFCLKTKKSV